MKALTLMLLAVLSLPVCSAELSNESATATAEPEQHVYYRWIDHAGSVHYTDFEPVGIPSQRLELDAPDDGEAINVIRSESDRTPDAFHDQDDQILPIEHVGPCADARRQLTVLHSRLPVYRDASGAFRTAWRGDSYRGERRYLETEERAAAIAAARRRVRETCSDPAAFDAEVETFRSRIESDPGSP